MRSNKVCGIKTRLEDQDRLYLGWKNGRNDVPAISIDPAKRMFQRFVEACRRVGSENRTNRWRETNARKGRCVWGEGSEFLHGNYRCDVFHAPTTLTSEQYFERVTAETEPVCLRSAGLGERSPQFERKVWLHCTSNDFQLFLSNYRETRIFLLPGGRDAPLGLWETFI